MIDGCVILYPPGTGKTRTTWGKVLRDTKSISQTVGRTFVVGPNKGIKQIWLRELVFWILENSDKKLKKKLSEKVGNKNIRKMSCSKLEGVIKQTLNRSIKFKTYSQLSKSRSCQCQVLIFDEWHRSGDKIKNYAKDFINLKHKKGCFRHLNITKKVFFVSATPLNPVLLEKETDIDEVSIFDMEEFKDRICKGTTDALAIIRAFCRVSKNIDDRISFKKAVRRLGIKILCKPRKKFIWKPPTKDKVSNIKGLKSNKFLEYLKNKSYNHWADEYAFCNGLIRTKSKDSVILHSRGPQKRYKDSMILHSRGPKKCFGYKYKALHIPTKKQNPVKWIKESLKFKFLIKTLRAYNILPGQINTKVLIFCIHQGTAYGLALALKSHFKNDDAKRIKHTLHLSSSDKEELIRRFNSDNGKNCIQILIATDAMSESIDLHQNCRILIHYQLPWSPLRLFQRVGRLTRICQKNGLMNKSVHIEHIIIPGSVEEERINRLIRRIDYLHQQGLWPENNKGKQYNMKKLAMGLIGKGPSLHYNEIFSRHK